jgi:hypothetical protein
LETSDLKKESAAGPPFAPDTQDGNKNRTVLMISTSSQGWLAELAKAYRNRVRVVLIDDANAGIDPNNQTILNMGMRSRLSRNEWIAVLLSVGLGIFGATIIILAILDPDPTSKLGLLIGSGAVMTIGGGFTGIRILANRKPPKVRLSQRGFEIEWD